MKQLGRDKLNSISKNIQINGAIGSKHHQSGSRIIQFGCSVEKYLYKRGFFKLSIIGSTRAVSAVFTPFWDMCPSASKALNTMKSAPYSECQRAVSSPRSTSRDARLHAPETTAGFA